jgi:predicted ferric reductase
MYPLFGGSRAGKDFLSDFVSNPILDPKGGIVLVMLVFPLLLAGSICSLLVTRERGTGRRSRPLVVSSRLPKWLQRTYQRIFSRNGDGNFDFYTVVFIMIPCIVYSVSSIFRHLNNREIAISSFPQHFQKMDYVASESTKVISNALGVMVMIAMTFFLVPVSKHGPILKLFCWSHARAVRLHIWCGRLIVIGSLFHGLLHLLRWKYLLGEKVNSFLLPPRQCWISDKEFVPQCKNPETECTCYSHFLYLTGVLACLALIVILVTSSNWVRRKFYSVFYISHLLVAPLFILVILLHYNRGILYVAPSVLYYLASSLPVFKERQLNRAGTNIVSVDHLACGSSKCVSLTIEASNDAMAAYRPGMYAQLAAPSISKVSHPFTINKVPGKDNQLRFIFRSIGSFTNELTNRLEDDELPAIHIDGFHGCPVRVEKLLQHDVVVLVAGGIGITPFLSLLSEVIAFASVADTQEAPLETRKVILHWMCRDAALVNYVRNEYFEPLLKAQSDFTRCQVDIIIHQTQGQLDAAQSESGSPARRHFHSEKSKDAPVKSHKQPLTLSRFSPGASLADNLNTFITHTIISWVGLAVAWFLYSDVQSEEQIWQRSLAPVAILVLSYVVSILSTRRFGSTQSKDTLPKASILEKATESNEKTQLLARVESMSSTDCYSFDEESPNEITLHTMNTGRPDIRVFLDDLDGSRHPGVFACGPPALTKEIKDIAEEKSCLRAEYEDGQSPFVTIYDEVFVM